MLSLNETEHVEKRLASNLDTPEFAIITINSSEEIIMFNRGSEKMFGYSGEEVVGKKFDTLIHAGFRQLYKKNINKFFKDEINSKISTDTTDVYCIRKDGEGFKAEVSISNANIDDKKIFIIILRDTTNRKFMEVGYRRYINELKEINESNKKNFSIIAHDLRNPFSAINSFINFFHDNFDSMNEEEMREVLTEMKSLSNGVVKLLENLLDWAFLQMGKNSINPQIVNINGLLESEIELLYKLADQKEIKIINEIDNKINGYCDGNMISTVIRNILSNSIKFTREKGIIKIFAFVSKNLVEINIQDNGIGMRKNILSNLMNLGKIEPQIGTMKEVGSGLGLLICKEFLQKNGGELNIISEENKGTLIRFTIPRYDKSLTENNYDMFENL